MQLAAQLSRGIGLAVGSAIGVAVASGSGAVVRPGAVIATASTYSTRSRADPNALPPPLRGSISCGAIVADLTQTLPVAQTTNRSSGGSSSSAIHTRHTKAQALGSGRSRFRRARAAAKAGVQRIVYLAQGGIGLTDMEAARLKYRIEVGR